MIYHILTKWHYGLLVIVTLYDIKYNYLNLTLVFYLLPWTYFYERYIRISHFLDGLWLPYVIYSTQLEVIDKETLIIDGELHDLLFYQKMYKHYV
jgi:hypothetical protein